MTDITQQTALVTGASSGIGKSIAKRLLADGFLVYVAARSIDKMTDLAELGAVLLRMDISKDEEIVAAVATIAERSGGVDVLVNNAGFGLYGPVEEVTIDEARYQFEVNVFGAARLTQLLLPAMRARGSGTIVNVTSMGGKIYTVLGAWYHATKHALEGWSDSLRLELEPFGIRVVVIEPGLIETGFGDAASVGLLERSGSGAYASIAQGVARSMDISYGHGQARAAEAGEPTLEEIRKLTDRYRDVNVALAEGYVRDPSNMCDTAEMMGRPAEAGAMGIHFFRPDLLGLNEGTDRVSGSGTHTDFRQPSILIYEPQSDGTLELVAVENLVFDAAWEAAGRGAFPSYAGQPYNPMRDDPETPLDEAHAFAPHHDLHVWLYRANPNGNFAQFNPAVSCTSHSPGSEMMETTHTHGPAHTAQD